jgi:hypothetical protein
MEFLNARNLNVVLPQAIQEGFGDPRVVLATWSVAHVRILTMSVEKAYSYYKREFERFSVSRAVYPRTASTLAPAVNDSDGINRCFWGEDIFSIYSPTGTPKYAHNFNGIFDCLTPDFECDIYTIQTATPLMGLLHREGHPHCVLIVGTNYGLGFAAAYFIDRCNDFRLCNWLARSMESVQYLSATLVEVITILSRRQLRKQLAINLIRGMRIVNVDQPITERDMYSAHERLYEDHPTRDYVCVGGLLEKYEFYLTRNVRYYLENDMHRSPINEGDTLHDLVINNFHKISTTMYMLYKCSCLSCWELRYRKRFRRGAIID